MNGYLPPALERKVRLLKKRPEDVVHWFCLTGFWGFGTPGSGIEFLLTQPRKSSTMQLAYASHIFTNCHQNNKQRTHIASGKNMHTKILYPLKIHGRPLALISRLLSIVLVILSTALHLGVGYSDTVSSSGRQSINCCSQVTKPLRIS